MSTTGILSSSSLNLTNYSDKVSSRKQYSQNLASSIESGNIDGAKQAFSQLLQTNLKSDQTNSTDSTISQDFKSLESALSSGDLTSVKSAFATLQRDTRSSDSSLSDSLQPSNLSLAQLAYSSLETYMRLTNQNSSKKTENSVLGTSATATNSYGVV